VLIDAGMDSSGSDVQKLLSAMQADNEEVRALLITHWHNDHAAGGQWARNQTGCQVYYDIAEKPWLSRETAQEGWRGWLARHIPEWGIGVLFIGLLGEAVPNAVDASEYVNDGQVLLNDFEVISTPGHTLGHTSFYYRPKQTLFAGDALAVIGDDVRFMARPVTPDVTRARESMEKCLRWHIATLCPGHRMPLTKNVAQSCQRMRDHLAAGGRWPLFG
jgi:glyoxylase-like metal-dependent hydrolase (beta-lactamase superfamily II)